MDPNKPVMCVGIPELDSVANFHRALHLSQQVQVVAINHVVPLLSELQLERATSDRASKAVPAAKPHSDGAGLFAAPTHLLLFQLAHNMRSLLRRLCIHHWFCMVNLGMNDTRTAGMIALSSRDLAPTAEKAYSLSVCVR